jgi:hypothetical protein
MRQYGSVALVLLLGVLGSERGADAAASARLFYGRSPDAEGCPDEAGLRRAIADRVGYDPVFPMAPNDIQVTITRSGQKLVAEAKFVDAGRTLVGARSFEVSVGHCDELVATIALTVAIALDRFEQSTPATPPTPAPQTDTASPATARDAAAPPPPPTQAASATQPDASPIPAKEVAQPPAQPPGEAPTSRDGVAVAAGIAGWAWTAPTLSLGPTALASMRWGRLTLGVEGKWELPLGAATRGLSTGELQTSFLGGGPLACLSFDPYLVCGLAVAGWLRADAPGVPGAVVRSTLDVQAGIRGGIDVDLGRRLFLRLSADLLVDAYTPAIRVSGVDEWRPSLVATGTQIALAWRIP